jgi:hypothetical protein
MTPERMAELVARWVRFYTRNVPTPIAKRRIEEIDADLRDHIAHERARGAGDRRIALSILSRMVRGLAADASWRGHHAKEKATSTSSTAYGSVVRVALVTGLILLVPLVAMQFTGEVVWTLTDFLVAGMLLGGTGLALDLAVTSGGNVAYKAAAGLALVAALLLVWVNLAVGIIGEPNERLNVMYLAVIAVGIAGSAIARLRPEGMARALLATAVTQAGIAVVALIAGRSEAPGSSVSDIVGVNAFFIALFIGSAWLFRRAARRQPPTDAAPAA